MVYVQTLHKPYKKAWMIVLARCAFLVMVDVDVVESRKTWIEPKLSPKGRLVRRIGTTRSGTIISLATKV